MIRRTRRMVRSRVKANVAVAIGLLCGCVATDRVGPEFEPVSTRPAIDYTLRGRVDFGPPNRKTQSGMSDVALAATVSLIDPNATPNKTVVTQVTTDSGAFVMTFPVSFVPGSTVYILEAIKGLGGNIPRRDAARIRTLLQFQAGVWQTITAGSVTISSGSTALALAYGLRLGSTSPPGSLTTFLGSLVEPASFTPGSTNVTAAEFTTLRALVLDALAKERDPVATIGWEPPGTYNLLSASTPLILGVAPPSAAQGTSVTISGESFLTPAASNTVTFNGTTASIVSVTATQLVVTVPSGATTGLLRITNQFGSSNDVNFMVVPNLGEGFSIY